MIFTSKPVDLVNELHAASRVYDRKEFAAAAEELARHRAMADRFRDVAPDEYVRFLTDYSIARRKD